MKIDIIFIGDFDGEDSNNSKSIKSSVYNIDRKITGCKELTIATVDNDIMVLRNHSVIMLTPSDKTKLKIKVCT